jgi:autotransporter-associated beta strand protein
MTFSGANTYTGPTTVGAGTLQMNASSLIALAPRRWSSATARRFQPGLNNFSQTVASLAGRAA